MNGIKGIRSIALDSNIFSYYFHKHPLFGETARDILRDIISSHGEITTSIITLIELLSLRAPPAKIEELKVALLEMPNLHIVDVNQEIGVSAAEIRRVYRFRIPDAIALATASYTKAQIFLTNDEKLKHFKKVQVVLLLELMGR